MRKAWPGLDPQDLPGNEVAQWYPLAVREVFGNPCEFVGELGFEKAAGLIREGRTIQVCLRSPGHFIALVAYDEEKSEFILRTAGPAAGPTGTASASASRVRTSRRT